MGGWFLSRRDSTIVARHEVPQNSMFRSNVNQTTDSIPHLVFQAGTKCLES
jgi:hypothetical protein